jgi:hypothetical protein
LTSTGLGNQFLKFYIPVFGFLFPYHLNVTADDPKSNAEGRESVGTAGACVAIMRQEAWSSQAVYNHTIRGQVGTEYTVKATTKMVKPPPLL